MSSAEHDIMSVHPGYSVLVMLIHSLYGSYAEIQYDHVSILVFLYAVLPQCATTFGTSQDAHWFFQFTMFDVEKVPMKVVRYRHHNILISRTEVVGC